MAGFGGAGSIVAGTAVVKMIPDFSGFGSKLNAGLNGFSQKASAIGGSLTKSLTLPILGIGVAAVKAFGDAEKVASQTEAVIKSTGGAAGVTAKEVDTLANSLAKKTAVDDEAIASGENLLLTFTNVKNEVGAGNDIFNQATATILDMSQALGQDTKASAIQLGKALNDPIKGITALSRVGVSFTAQQKEQIKTLVESGHTMEAQKIILAELTKEFGGSAEAFAQTSEGKMKQALNELGNAAESLGAILLPVVTAVSNGLATLAGWFQNLSPGMQQVIAIVLGVVAAFGPLLLIGAKLVTAFQIVVPAISAIFGAISAAFSFLLANPIVLAIAALIVVIILIVKNWDKVKAALIAIWNAIAAAAKAVFGALVAVFTAYMNIYKVVILAVWNAIKVALSAIWNGIKAAASAIWGAIKAVFSAYVGVYKAIIVGGWNAIKAALSAIWNGLVSAVRAAWNTIVGIIRSAIDAVMGPINALKSAVSWLLPGSPVPFVVGLEKSAAALRALGAEARRISLPTLAAPALNAARTALHSGDSMGRGSYPAGGDARTFNLTVNAKQSVGSIRSDFRLMEAMAG